VPDFKTGDIVKVFTKDSASAKARATPFEGIVIAIGGGKDNKTFTVRKIASSQVAVERIFPLASPAVEKIEIIKKGNVRRAKLYHLRKRDSSARSHT